MASVKYQLQKIADILPDDATWEQVRYEIHVREQIEEGEAAVREGQVVPHDEVKKHFARK